MVIRIYWASVTGNRKISGEQTRLRNLIECLRIPSEWIDITTDSLVKEKMREECGNPKAMPPQIFNEFRYLGDVGDMEEFVEQGRSREWFGVDDNTGNDVTLSSVTNGIIGASKSAEDETVNERLQDSPTSSTENDPAVTPTKSIPNGGPPPSRKTVLAAAGAFEALEKQPPVQSNKSKVIFTQSRSLDTNHCENKTALDDERRMRILGLSNADNSAAGGVSNDERSA